MNKPAVSVVIPCYNCEKWIRECLDSVRNQTFADFEVICVNDGSTDETAAILKEYAHGDPRFKVFYKENEKSPALTNKYGLEQTNGKYVYRLDSDDVISENLLEEMYLAAEQRSADIVIPMLVQFHGSIPSTESVDQNQYGIENSFFFEDGRFLDKEDRLVVLSGRDAALLSLKWDIHARFLVLSEITHKVPLEEYGSHGDEFTARKWLLNGNRIVFSKGIYFYRQLPESYSHKAHITKFYLLENNYGLYTFCQENNFGINYENYFLQNQCFLIYSNLLNLHTDLYNLSQTEKRKLRAYTKSYFQKLERGISLTACYERGKNWSILQKCRRLLLRMPFFLRCFWLLDIYALFEASIKSVINSNRKKQK